MVDKNKYNNKHNNILKILHYADNSDIYNKHNKYYEYIDFFKKIHEDFVIILTKNLFQYIKKTFNINIFHSSIQLSYKYNCSLKNNSVYLIIIKFIHIECNLIVSLSSILIRKIEECLFGKIRYSSYYKNHPYFTTSQIYIINKLIKIIISSYHDIFNNVFSIQKKYFIFKNDIDYHIVSNIKNTCYLNTYFECMNETLQHAFSISIPCMSIEYLKKNYFYNTLCKNTELVISKQELNTLKNIYNKKLNIIAKLNKFSILMSKIINLRVGDVLHIEKPEDIIVYTYNGIPVLRGIYNIDRNNIILCIKNNIINSTEVN